MSDDQRQQHVIDTLESAFADLMDADPVAFRVKFRKMAGNPFAFFRGTACLIHRDLAATEQPWADERTGRVWIHGDLHPENFGTYVNSHGELVFDVNDFDEAYIGPFAWDLRRFVAGVAVLAWQKALPEQTARTWRPCASTRTSSASTVSSRGPTMTTSPCARATRPGRCTRPLQRARSSSRAVVAALGQATAKIHCVSDADSDHTIVDFQTEEAIAQVLHDRQEEFVREIVDFGIEYAQRVRDDHALFVDAFREGRIGSVRSV